MLPFEHEQRSFWSKITDILVSLLTKMADIFYHMNNDHFGVFFSNGHFGIISNQNDRFFVDALNNGHFGANFK